MHSLQSLYQDVKCCVRLNSLKTDWFEVSCGLKQGCLLSPLLFNMYVNDLATSLQDLNLGVQVGPNERVGVLLYADDIVVLAESEAELQVMLHKLSDWCVTWQMKVNTEKQRLCIFVLVLRHPVHSLGSIVVRPSWRWWTDIVTWDWS